MSGHSVENPVYFRAILGPVTGVNVSVSLLDDGSMVLFDGSTESTVRLTCEQRRQLEKISKKF